MTEYVIAIDGPSGVGKTSVSRAMAESLGCEHLDTGAFYRAATVVALVCKVDLSMEAAVLAAVAGARFRYEDGVMLVEGVDMSQAIRSAVVTEAVSQVAAYPSVRTVLVAEQQNWVVEHGGRAVVEGRDIGTVVFVDTPYKFFLTARPELRAARRAGETVDGSVKDVQDQLERRDAVDSTREASPLTAASDAMVVDTSDIGQLEVTGLLMSELERRGLVP